MLVVGALANRSVIISYIREESPRYMMKPAKVISVNRVVAKTVDITKISFSLNMTIKATRRFNATMKITAFQISQFEGWKVSRKLILDYASPPLESKITIIFLYVFFKNRILHNIDKTYSYTLITNFFLQKRKKVSLLLQILIIYSFTFFSRIHFFVLKIKC